METDKGINVVINERRARLPDLGPLQQQDLAIHHAVADHPPEDGSLRPHRADAVSTRLHQGLLVDVMEVT